MSSCFNLSFHFVWCILIGLMSASKPLSVLLLVPFPMISHHIWAENLSKELLRKGHHVHVASIHEPKIEGKLAENLTYAVFDGFLNKFAGYENFNAAEWSQYSTLYTAYSTYKLGIHVSDIGIKIKKVKELLKMIKTVQVDVIVMDIVCPHCFLGLSEVAKGKPPIVGFLTMGNAPWFKVYIGGPNYPTVRPYMHEAMVKPVGLWGRTWNVLYYIVDDLLRYYYYMPIMQRINEEYIGHAIRPLDEIDKDNINFVLVNSHPAFDSAIPLPPNALEVGGLSAQAVQPIAGEVIVKCPEDLRIFLDGAKSGAIVISLGTNLKWKFFGLDKIKSVILALSKLKQRILWKLDIKVPFEIPDNVMVVKWMPQNEVLSHKNVRAVWTHGGLLSTQEAIWKGVPMIVTPFFMDQKSNTEILVAKGVAIHLDIEVLSTQTLSHAVEEILYNGSYSRNMKQLSSEFRDRPIPPLDLAVWGIEYAARHPNRTLVTPLKFQSWIEQNLVDVYAFLFFILIITLLSIFLLIKIVINFCCNRTTSKLRKSKQA